MRKKPQKRAGARKAILRSRIEADAFLAAIVESSHEAIISEDVEGTITRWNKAAERLFGYRAEAMIGKSVAAIQNSWRVENRLILSSMEINLTACGKITSEQT